MAETENTRNVSNTEQAQVANEDGDANCDCEDCQTEQTRGQEEGEKSVVVVVSPESGAFIDNTAAPSKDAKVSIISDIESDREPDTVSHAVKSTLGQVNKWKKAKPTMMHGQQGQQRVTVIKHTLFPVRGPSSVRPSILAPINPKGAPNRRPFRLRKTVRCIWPGCAYTASSKGNVIMHIRAVHFKLPKTKKRQAQLFIVDYRNPYHYLEMIFG